MYADHAVTKMGIKRVGSGGKWFGPALIAVLLLAPSVADAADTEPGSAAANVTGQAQPSPQQLRLEEAIARVEVGMTEAQVAAIDRALIMAPHKSSLDTPSGVRIVFTYPEGQEIVFSSGKVILIFR